MGSKKSKSSTQPAFPEETRAVRDVLTPFMTQRGTEQSQFYSDLERMFKGLTQSGSYALPDYLSRTLEEAVSTGFGGMGDISESSVYKATMPTFLRNLQTKVLPAVSERFAGTGALRSSDYARAATEAGAGAEGDFLMQILPHIIAADEASKARRMQGISLGYQGAMLPWQMAEQSAKAASAIDEGRYPNLAEMIAYATAGAGSSGVSKTREPMPWSSYMPNITIGI